MQIVRCSGLARVMACAGSLCFPVVEETTDAASEGTAAGEYLERLLTSQQFPPMARNGVRFDSDMIFYVKPHAERILKVAQSQVLCETKIGWEPAPGIRVQGSSDVSYITGNDLNIEDLKYGWGIVEAKGNWQLLGYAIGEVMRRGIAFDNIHMRIIQPRPQHEEGELRTWTITYNDLLNFKDQIDKRMQSIAAGNRELTTGAGCKYCPAAAKCPALGKAFYRGVEVSQAFLEDNLDEKELAFQLDLIARIEEIVKIRKRSLETLTMERIKQGAVIPGYSTEKSFGDRKWKGFVSPEVVQTMTGIDVTDRVMLSPAKAEKLGVPKEVVNSLVDRHFLGNKLVRKDNAAVGNKIFGTEAPKQMGTT